MTWVYLVTGIVCLVAMQSLRGALAMVFPVRDVQPSASPEPRQFGGFDLIDEMSSQLEPLGFEGPAWLCDEEHHTDIAHRNFHAVYRNVAQNTIAWVGPTQDLANPDQLNVYYTTALDDGRYAVTQVCDPYFSAVDDPKTPAQTIAATDKATELGQHLDFVQSVGTPPLADAPIREAVLRFAGDHMNSIRQRLLECGRLRERDGIARPAIGFAISILRYFATRPVTKPTENGTIPTARLTYLARLAQKASERAPAQPMQWFLLILSAILFLVIGWPLFGLNYTVIILAVILFHEAGHWAAMKAFGYRNPHITLLPLLGGVTIGHERDPGAAKRLWVSLAGPLPGIVLGWALIIYFSADTSVEFYSEWILPTIGVLLFINYLNILPIPPLDGSHAVKALLPPQWVFVQIIVVFAGVLIGGYVAWLLDFWPLALIAGLQLFAVKNLWQDASLVRHFGNDRPPQSDDDETRIEWLLQKLEALIGEPKKAVKRIGLARDILSQLDMRPMGGLHRTLASVVYLGLVAVPATAIAFSMLEPFSFEFSEEAEAMYEEFDAQDALLATEAESMTLQALAASLAGPGKIPAPATEAELLLAGNRLGRALPGPLAEFYLQLNGLQDYGIGPVESIRRVGPELFSTSDLQYSVYDDKVSFYDENYDEVSVAVDAIDDWWQLGHDPELGAYLFVNPQAAPGASSVFAFDYEDAAAYRDLAAMLRAYWVRDRSNEIYVARVEERYRQAALQMEGLSMAELLEKFPRPGFIVRLITGGGPVTGPADAESIADTERRIGRALPDDHRQLFALHNGFDMMSLLPVEDIQRASLSDSSTLADALEVINAGATGAEQLTIDELENCWTIAGYADDQPDETGLRRMYGRIFWCPDLDVQRQYVSPDLGGYHPTFVSIVRQSAARMTSAF